MSLLVDRQSAFLLSVGKLVLFATELGYKVTIGEAERTKDQAEIYYKQGKGILSSKHCQRLAVDLNFYKAGKLINDRVSLESIGAFWEHLGGVWGGRFKKYDDSRHFEAR